MGRRPSSEALLMRMSMRPKRVEAGRDESPHVVGSATSPASATTCVKFGKLATDGLKRLGLARCQDQADAALREESGD